MSTTRSIPDEVRRRQQDASDPDVSAWVAANAGAGKTYVLAQRVINLLLKGAEPEKILCITFTKAAAANMAKQVFDRLAHWTTLNDADLDQAIRDHSRMTPGGPLRMRARQLFARALETPGGLKVQTIHAFCTQLLHQFPFEANVTARFAVLDDAEHSQLLEKLTLAVLLDGAAAPDSRLGRALAFAMTAAADQTFRDVIREAIGRHEAITRWVENAGSIDAAIAGLSARLGVDPADELDNIEAEYFSGQIIAPAEWLALAEVLDQGNKTDRAQADRFRKLATLSGSELVNGYLDIFCTGDGRSPRKSIVTKAITDGSLTERLAAEQQRVCAILRRARAVICRDRSAALLIVTHEVLRRYRAEKERRGLLDYDDLIDKTLTLLTSCDASWVHYKLDLGIDHVLVDEAQDTSTKQWSIVRLLTAEFTAGAGARSAKRTIFAVGDEKQSIYSFQNAAPKEFAEMLRHFKTAHDNSRQTFVVSKFEHSFRSGDSVLGAVDEVFRPTDVARSVTSDLDGFPPHIALPDAAPSLVEIWDTEQPDERKAIEGWDAPFDTVSETSPRVKLARRIARAVRRAVDSGRARYGDILILVRQRGELFEGIIRALKNQQVQVAGADRLVLTEHIAVMDLMALADALLLPQDDLALATVLRSPLFGFEDGELFDIAWDRGRATLRTALNRKAGERSIYAAAAARLDELAAAARRDTPFLFFAHLLGPGGARARFLARLGPEANDALDEFLNVAFDYERRETPSLQGFLAWLRDARAEVKRDMEIARDEVRVMTVHGAKGLEASMVILADTVTPPGGPRPPRLLQFDDNVLVWTGRKDDDPGSVAASRTAVLTEAEHEYRRLLYVAMTRAADTLIICGADGLRSRPKGCWYDLVRGALDPLLVEETDNEEKVFRYRKHKPGVTAQRERPAIDGAVEPVELPRWLRQAASEPRRRRAPLSPSALFDENASGGARAEGAAATRQKALARGRLVHRLLQALPDIPPARRQDASERYLAKAAADFADAERVEIIRQVFAILDDATFAPLFTTGSRPEVPIVGHISRAGAEPMPVSGQVDRLAILDDGVLIADYKSDRAIPSDISEVEPYVAQLGLYRAVLSRLYPGKRVRAALVLTEGPRLIELPEAAMDAALVKVLTTGSHSAVKVP